MTYICGINFKFEPMKTILAGMILLMITLSFTLENGKLSGVVTYNDVYEPSNLADAGGEIYAISEADAKSAKYGNVAKVIGRFMTSKSDYSQTLFFTIDPERVRKVEDYFDSVAAYTSNYITGFKKVPAVARATANAKGLYTLNLKPGKNYVLFISGNLKSDNIAESKGNIDMKVVDIKSEGEIQVDANFKRHENFMIMLLTGRWLQGC
jgi:hypothetical protein